MRKNVRLLDSETGKRFSLSVLELLAIINEDRNPEWIKYTLKDWREGWEHFGLDGIKVIK